MYGLLVFIHVLGAFLFVLAHGASMVVSFRLRSERDPVRQTALFELSSTGINMMYVGLVILLLAGIAAGFVGGHWGRGWIWASLGTLVVVMAVMYSVATPFYGRMRGCRCARPGPGGSADEAATHVPGPPAPRDFESPHGACRGGRHRPGLDRLADAVKAFLT